MWPLCVIGVRPAISSSGTLSRAGVHQRAHGVAGADRDVNHDAGGFAGRLVIAVGHRDREVLVGNRQELRDWLAAARERDERLDHGREVRARVGEHVIDAAALERAQERFRNRARLGVCSVHPCPPTLPRRSHRQRGAHLTVRPRMAYEYRQSRCVAAPRRTSCAWAFGTSIRHVVSRTGNRGLE